MKKITTLFCALVLSGASFAQIPNAGFETWTTVGTYEDPSLWENPNFTTTAYSTTIYTCQHGTAGAPEGTSFLQLVTQWISGTVAPGVATTGNLGISVSPLAYGVSGGFPYSSRPVDLTGKWKHSGSGGSSSDNGRVIVYFTKWDIALSKRDTIGWADSMLTGIQTTWANFSIPITYLSGLSPDTAQIVLSSSYNTTTALSGSFLYVDDLKFPISVTGSSSVCVGSTTTLSTSGSIGTWSSSATSIATVDASGTVTGLSAGVAMISYTEGSTIGTKVVTVSSCPAGIAFAAGDQTLNIYPNPSSGTCFIDIPAGEKNITVTVTVTDVLGKTVFTATPQRTGTVQFNMPGVSRGSYFVKVAIGEKVYRSKIAIVN